MRTEPRALCFQKAWTTRSQRTTRTGSLGFSGHLLDAALRPIQTAPDLPRLGDYGDEFDCKTIQCSQQISWCKRLVSDHTIEK